MKGSASRGTIATAIADQPGRSYPLPYDPAVIFTLNQDSRLVELGEGPAERRALFAELEREPVPAGRGDAGEYVDILREAVAARNGWKRILARCAPARRVRRLPPMSREPGAVCPSRPG